MPIQRNMCGVGIVPGAAQHIAGDVDASVTATGSTSQANSYLVRKAITLVTVTAAATGVRLPASLNAGDSGVVSNLGAETLFVYPPTGGAINAGSDNAKVDVATVKSCIWVAHGNDDFTVIVGA